MRLAVCVRMALGLAVCGLLVAAEAPDQPLVVAPPGPYLGQAPPGKEPIVFAEEIVSTDDNDVSCAFTPDGRYFFFTSRRAGSDDVYWVDASVIDSLRKDLEIVR